VGPGGVDFGSVERSARSEITTFENFYLANWLDQISLAPSFFRDFEDFVDYTKKGNRSTVIGVAGRDALAAHYLCGRWSLARALERLPAGLRARFRHVNMCLHAAPRAALWFHTHTFPSMHSMDQIHHAHHTLHACEVAMKRSAKKRPWLRIDAVELVEGGSEKHHVIEARLAQIGIDDLARYQFGVDRNSTAWELVFPRDLFGCEGVPAYSPKKSKAYWLEESVFGTPSRLPLVVMRHGRCPLRDQIEYAHSIGELIGVRVAALLLVPDGTFDSDSNQPGLVSTSPAETRPVAELSSKLPVSKKVPVFWVQPVTRISAREDRAVGARRADGAGAGSDTGVSGLQLPHRTPGADIAAFLRAAQRSNNQEHSSEPTLPVFQRVSAGLVWKNQTCAAAAKVVHLTRESGVYYAELAARKPELWHCVTDTDPDQTVPYGPEAAAAVATHIWDTFKKTNHSAALEKRRIYFESRYRSFLHKNSKD
jgi:hypothetical protein